MLIIEIIIVLALFVLNGFFAMAELAIVSSRRAHLERHARRKAARSAADRSPFGRLCQAAVHRYRDYRRDLHCARGWRARAQAHCLEQSGADRDPRRRGGLAKEGRPGAQVALALADDPACMLAAVEIGLTTTATLAGIFSGSTLSSAT
jgi:CBS domain containing-hemolysin-like protein